MVNQGRLTMPILTKRLTFVWLLAALGAGGCGDDEGAAVVDAAPVVIDAADAGGLDAAGGSSAEAGAEAGAEVGGETGADSGPPLYAVMTQVYRLDDRSVFVTLSNTLDITTLDLPNAR